MGLGMKPRARIWIEENGKPLFGDGKVALLESIERHGSMNKAAKEFGMSYLHLLKKIKTLEKRLGKKLVETSTGGKGGGGTRLTKDGRDILKKYTRFRKLADKELQRIFDRVSIN